MPTRRDCTGLPMIQKNNSHIHYFNQVERVIKIFKSSFKEKFAMSSHAAEGWCLSAKTASNPARAVILMSEYRSNRNFSQLAESTE